MKLTLGQNIRAFRRQRRLTQEQFAEVLGVTAGAVHKWESGLSEPELNLIVEMADFFDTSVDVLVGYRIKDNRQAAIIQRLDEYCRTMNPEALAEVEKALKKYPHSFDIVFHCAAVCIIFGIGDRGRANLRRALELLEQARLLIAQNRNPEISELTIFGQMAAAYVMLDEYEKGVALLKQHNVDGIFSDFIGITLAIYMKQPQEAEPFLLNALLQSTSTLLNAITGYSFVFCSRGAYESAREIVQWGIDIFLGMKTESAPDFTEKIYAFLLILLAHTQIKTDMKEDARASLQKAAELAARFDATPDYGMRSTRFVQVPERENVHDILGITAAESADQLLRLLKNPELSELWKEAVSHG